MRQKSNRTLLIEQERAARKEERERKKAEKERDKNIREDRRERKQTEQEAKRTIRAKKKATHEHVVKNGVPKVQSGGQELGIREAIAYSPLVLCGGCGVIIRESALIEVQSAQQYTLNAKQEGASTGGQVGSPMAQESQEEKRRA